MAQSKVYSISAAIATKSCNTLCSLYLHHPCRCCRDATAAGAAPGPRDAAVAVHPGLVATWLARNYFKGSVPRLLRPLTDPFFEHVFGPYLLRRWVIGWVAAAAAAAAAAACTDAAVCAVQGVLRREAATAVLRPPPLQSTSPAARSPAAAADTLLYAATAPAEEVGGQYCGTAPQVGHHSRAAGDPALAQRLWQFSAHLCQLSPEDTLS